jgi:SAM-dependent methyltransferase
MVNTALIDAEQHQVAWGNYETNLHFLELVRLPPAPQRILEIGCGKGAMLSHLQRAGHVVHGVDIDAVALAECAAAHPELRVTLASGDQLPLASGAFDLVLSFDVFEHIRDSDRHLSEVRRVLAPGGQYLLQTPNKWTNLPFEVLRQMTKLHLGPMAAYREATRDHCALHNYWELRRRFAAHRFDLRFFAVPVVNEYFRRKMRHYLGVLGPALLTVLNPDEFPIYLQTNFYAQGLLR